MTTTLNTDLLRQVADRIELEDRFDMNYWGAYRGGYGAWCAFDTIDDPTVLVYSCRTTGCVAGWTNALLRHSLSDAWGAARALAGPGADELLVGRLRWRLFFTGSDGADEPTLWEEHAEALGWTPARRVTPTAVQAAKLLRWLADGEVEL